MNRFFTADWHLFHRNIYKFVDRGVHTIEQMHQALVLNHNQIVGEDDETWVIGDVALMPAEHAGKVKKQVERFNGVKHLVLGNHDDWKAKSYEKAGFWTVHTAMWFYHEGLTFYMMHDPAKYSIIENDPKAVMLCGHVHQLFKHLLPEKRVINVGVDVWGLKPVSFDQILELLRENKIL